MVKYQKWFWMNILNIKIDKNMEIEENDDIAELKKKINQIEEIG